MTRTKLAAPGDKASASSGLRIGKPNDAFEREAADYLLKPVSDDRLLRTILRLKARLAKTEAPPQIGALVEALRQNLGGVAIGKLRWIGFVARTSQQDALPTVTQRALEALRTEAPATFDDATRAELDRELAKTKEPSTWAWFKVCIDGSGAVTGVHPRATPSDTVGGAPLRPGENVNAAGLSDHPFNPR